MDKLHNSMALAGLGDRQDKIFDTSLEDEVDLHPLGKKSTIAMCAVVTSENPKGSAHISTGAASRMGYVDMLRTLIVSCASNSSRLGTD